MPCERPITSLENKQLHWFIHYGECIIKHVYVNIGKINSSWAALLSIITVIIIIISACGSSSSSFNSGGGGVIADTCTWMSLPKAVKAHCWTVEHLFLAAGECGGSRQAATPCGHTCEQHLRPPPPQAAPTSEQETIKVLPGAASASPSHPWSGLSSGKSSR